MITGMRFAEEYYTKHYKESAFRARGDKPLHYKFWVNYIQKYNRSKKMKILECGCGFGFFLKRAEKFCNCTGIEVSKYAAIIAKNNTRKAEIIVGDASMLPFQNSCFDAVVSFDMVEHMTFPIVFLKEAYRILNSGGMFILQTPNLQSVGRKLKGEEWYGFSDETHVSLLPPETWKKMIKEAHFTILDTGTDQLWDYPYFKRIPAIIQSTIFKILCALLLVIKGFYHWSYGENLIIIAKKELR